MDAFVEMIATAKLAAPTVSVQAQAKLDAFQCEAAEQLMAKYSEHYRLNDDD